MKCYKKYSSQTQNILFFSVFLSNLYWCQQYWCCCFSHCFCFCFCFSVSTSVWVSVSGLSATTATPSSFRLLRRGFIHGTVSIYIYIWYISYIWDGMALYCMDLVTHLNLSGANGQDDPEAPQQQITTQSGAHCSHSFFDRFWILVRVSFSGSQSESDYDSQSPYSKDCFYLFFF